jgi:hypothetical protein
VFQLRFATELEEVAFESVLRALSDSDTAWNKEEQALAAAVRNEHKEAHRRAVEPKFRPRFSAPHLTVRLIVLPHGSQSKSIIDSSIKSASFESFAE